MARRYQSPFNGKRYVVNTNPKHKEIHDLDNEHTSCDINKITTSHIKMLDTYSEVENYIKNNPGYDGCYWCLNELHTK
ncbi:hypothetical protein [Aneurinibacillus aneurinilyticus]|uniref:hypothetical protein n=1 Tax=Aneurinibacillus aneurinilyticus TaxID=1391 RepID=UPI0023F9042D|nr:hypothetical protein [Aneurinibacillus aneurinilyticus]MCI1693301.1 hypothetical protein [Aneurinibacillus aneurinilyticus]